MTMTHDLRTTSTMACVISALCVLSVVEAQQVGLLNDDAHPAIPLKKCTHANGCTPERASITFDANTRWQHGVNCNVPAGAACYPLGECIVNGHWNKTFCNNPVECAKNCAIEGIDFPRYDKHGVFHVENGVELKFVKIGANGMAIASRLYMMDNDDAYKVFHLKNKEFTFTVDTSTLPCGANGALYFVEMMANGGLSDTNKAGAKYGTGYCDAQCPHDNTFLNGKANMLDWNAAKQEGRFGHCCAEVDVWEANNLASSFTLHPCRNKGQTVCQGAQCVGACDKKGCGFNSLRVGDKFYGKGAEYTIDTTKPITVVTQFLTADGTDTGALSEVKRIFIQDGKIVHNDYAGGSSATDASCKVQKDTWGLAKTGEALDRGMVMTLSLWEDKVSNMKWLDSVDGKPGPCSGAADIDYKKALKTSVKYTDFMYGELGSTIKEHTTRGAPKTLKLVETPSNGGPLRGFETRGWLSQRFGPMLIFVAIVPVSFIAYIATRRMWFRQEQATRPYDQLLTESCQN